MQSHFSPGSRNYSTVVRLSDDKPTLIHIPVGEMGSSSADLSHLFTNLNDTLNVEECSSSSPNASVADSDPTSVTLADHHRMPSNPVGSLLTSGITQNTSEYIYTFDPLLIRKRQFNRRAGHDFSWYSSKGAFSLKEPPKPPQGVTIAENILFIHRNTSTDSVQFWWRSTGPDAIWEPIKLHAEKEFKFGDDEGLYYLTLTGAGDPSWVKQDTNKRKRPRG